MPGAVGAVTRSGKREKLTDDCQTRAGESDSKKQPGQYSSSQESDERQVVNQRRRADRC
jgi:hypothetical protein